ncbi:hypothetical protein PRIPAC_88678 [Pristionchus pacificus]|uniref:Uncharacterized protein n=1 Tax=Pristionchus pacificus TaxID=54126 RepID=A0A2A6B7K2_PRIPA|nr:hypothetical protein PRIPAC_88678 [Pristionchus pacificus]|eukprot:PDM61869.1 hypothetical protein PRIPAC_51311 [Pristionchus pacificus]
MGQGNNLVTNGNKKQKALLALTLIFSGGYPLAAIRSYSIVLSHRSTTTMSNLQRGRVQGDRGHTESVGVNVHGTEGVEDTGEEVCLGDDVGLVGGSIFEDHWNCLGAEVHGEFIEESGRYLDAAMRWDSSTKKTPAHARLGIRPTVGLNLRATPSTVLSGTKGA